LIIEAFGSYWHGEKRTGMTNEEAVAERTEHFAKYGYKTLVIWENEMKNISNVRIKILEFCNGGA
jgi:very-short-patch-repair endonuclease